MLLSTRDRHTDTLAQKPLSDILSTLRRSSIPSSIVQTTQSTPRLPLASPLAVPQSVDKMSPASSSSSLTQDHSDTHQARYRIGRRIVDTRTSDDEDTQNRNPIAPQSTTGISTSRRDNAPAGLPSKPSKSLASQPAVHLRAPSPMSPTTVTSPTFQFKNIIDLDKNPPNPAYLTNVDLYSNLATFSFGSPRSPSRGSSSSHYDADVEVTEPISPLTPMVRRPSADRTPRPSVSAQSPGKQPSGHQAQHRQSRNPSSSTSRPRDTGNASSSRDDDDESEDPVDFDYRPRRGRAMSDAVSRHTFGGRDIRGRTGSPSASVSSSRSGSRSSVRSGLEFSSEDEVELDYDSAHGTYTQAGLDIDDLGASGEYIDPTAEGRRGSLPMAIPGAIFTDDDGSRVREDSLVTLRRPSRSLDDDLMMSNVGAAVGDATAPKSEPHSRGDWRNLEAQHQQQQQDQTQPAGDVYDGLNLAYILDSDGTTGSRRASLAPSYVQTVPRGLPSRQSIGFRAGGWGAGLAWSAAARRRSSTATTGTANEDAFASHVKRFDGDYDQMASEWSFKKEKADGPGLNPGHVVWSKRGRDLATTSGEERERVRRRTTMVPGTQELWRNDLVGRFKVDRLALKSRSQDPRKPPQQRLNVRHITDPFSKGNKHGGPSSVVHKHSKAAAFSLFRHYGLLTRGATLSPGSPLPAAAAPRPLACISGGIMLAPKKVQEQYTSTRTTSKLTTHGLLGEADQPERSGRSSRPATGGAQRASSVVRKEKEKKEKERKEKEKKQREKDEKTKAKAKKVQQKRIDPTESAESSSTAFSAQTTNTTGSGSTKVEGSEGRQRRHSAYHTGQALSSTEPSSSSSNGNTTTTPSNVKRRSSFEISRTDSISNAGPSTRISEDTLSRPADGISEYSDNTLMDRYAEDTDDEPLPVTRTPHAEAFATLDPNVIEYVRSKSGNRMVVDGHSVHWSKRWLPGFGRPAKSSNAPASPAGTSSAALEATYHPPWMTIAGRKMQENNERLIQNLNESFKDVGLLHATLKPNKSTTKSSRRHKTGLNLFEEVPDDALYMLLPLWAGETDKVSMPSSSSPSFDLVAVDQRQYLLVYYVPFEGCPKEKSQELTKKKTKSSLPSPESSLDSMDSKTVMLSAFRVSARLVGYNELRGSGVRLPSTGLTVTGPLWEAQYSPPTGLCAEHHDDVVVAACYGREKGIEFLPDGLVKLGLCVLSSELAPGELEPQVLLSAIGRAAVEMVWLGCMALTSFGAT